MKNGQSHQRMVNQAQGLQALKDAYLVLNEMEANGITELGPEVYVGVEVLAKLQLIEVLPDGKAIIRS